MQLSKKQNRIFYLRCVGIFQLVSVLLEQTRHIADVLLSLQQVFLEN